jgi:hypothetical protein
MGKKWAPSTRETPNYTPFIGRREAFENGWRQNTDGWKSQGAVKDSIGVGLNSSAPGTTRPSA